MPQNGLCMVGLTNLEMEEGFENDHILDLVCNLMGEEQPQITMTNEKTLTVGEHMAYMNTCLSSRVPSTLIKAVEIRFLMIFPGLTNDNIRKNLPTLIAEGIGHLPQHQKNEISTRLKAPKPRKASTIKEDVYWIDLEEGRMHKVYANTIYT